MNDHAKQELLQDGEWVIVIEAALMVCVFVGILTFFAWVTI